MELGMQQITTLGLHCRWSGNRQRKAGCSQLPSLLNCVSQPPVVGVGLPQTAQPSCKPLQPLFNSAGVPLSLGKRRPIEIEKHGFALRTGRFVYTEQCEPPANKKMALFCLIKGDKDPAIVKDMKAHTASWLEKANLFFKKMVECWFEFFYCAVSLSCPWIRSVTFSLISYIGATPPSLCASCPT